MELSKILDFVRLLNQLQKVKRTIYVTGEDRDENDVEHSFQLAMLGWYIVEGEKLDLNKDLVIKYALVHDLVEAYAGDVPVYDKDQSLKDAKHTKEREALERIKSEHPELSEMYELIEKYEAREDRESKFVYALDKLQPALNIYTDGGRTWKKLGITLEMIIAEKTDKVALSPEVQKHFIELVSLLKSEKERLW